MNSEIDFIAQALYAAEHDEPAWDQEAESVKEEFRGFARVALGLLAQHREEKSAPETCVFPYAA